MESSFPPSLCCLPLCYKSTQHFFCENQMDFNKVHLHEATLNLQNDWSSTLDSQKSTLLWFARLLTLLISGEVAKIVWIKWAAPVVQSFSLEYKSVKSTKHYLTQMMLAINWCYWQARQSSNTRMCVKVQGHLMRVYLFEIHQVLQNTQKKNKAEYFSNRVVYLLQR